MSGERVATGLAVCLCLALAIWNVRLQTQVGELQTQLTQSDPAPSATPHAARPATDGRPQAMAQREERRNHPRSAGEDITPGRDLPPPPPGGGGPGRGGPPSEQDWSAMRADMETQTIDVVEAFGTQHSWEAELTEEVLAVLLDNSDRMAELWGSVHAGERTHFEARKEMRAMRDETSDALSELVGEAQHEALEEHLFEARRETWRRHGPE